MTSNGTTTQAPAGAVGLDPKATVDRFFELLTRNEVDAATALLAEDVVYENKSLPTVHGRSRTAKLFHLCFDPAAVRFEAYLHRNVERTGEVMTERTDVIEVGPVRIQFWVCGVHVVEDGEITLWRDYFDWGNMTVALTRGLLGAIVPAVKPRPPS